MMCVGCVSWALFALTQGLGLARIESTVLECGQRRI